MCLRSFSLFLILALALLLPACSSIEYAPDQMPWMVVLHDEVPFYLHGPAQGNGSDRTLAKGDEVQVVRKEFGFSFVQLEDGKKGFVANEELAVAPPRPSPTPTPASASASNGGSTTSIPDFWPQQKALPDLPAQEETNAPLSPPGFRY
jgi:hypothetical protein